MNEEAVVTALQGCSFHPLLMLVQKAFIRTGLGDVEIQGRRKTGQKSRFGGHELVCWARMGERDLKVVVKVIRDHIRVRMLDEHVGVVDRTNADFGIVVSPYTLTGNAARELKKYHSARLEIVDGAALAALIAKTNLGVRPNGEPDYAFFGLLEEESKRILKCTQPCSPTTTRP